MNDPICNERGVSQSECPWYCRHGDQLAVVCVNERPPFHVAHCEHPHRDCYCETDWYDDQPRVDCEGCP